MFRRASATLDVVAVWRIPRLSNTTFLIVSVCLAARAANAQSPSTERFRFETAVHMVAARSGEFDAADAGFGGRIAFRPVTRLGLEAEMTIYPRAFPARQPFSRGRIEGLFGITVGATYRRVRPFARLRPGFVAIADSPRPFACIKIFPPPLVCTLASGRTLPALDVGGGLEVAVTFRTLVRVDVGDRLLRYPAPAFDGDRMIRQRPFFGHAVRIAMGAGLRF